MKTVMQWLQLVGLILVFSSAIVVASGPNLKVSAGLVAFVAGAPLGILLILLLFRLEKSYKSFIDERVLSEELAYNHLHPKLESGLYHSDAFAEQLAMNFLARNYHNAVSSVLENQKKLGVDDSLSEKATEQLKEAKSQYWKMSRILSKKSMRSEKKSWIEDLPEDLR